MGKKREVAAGHPAGGQPGGELAVAPVPVDVETFGGRVHVEWDDSGRVTWLGQLPFFVEFLKEGGLFDGWVADCPLALTSPNAPAKRDILGTVLLSVLAGHWRYAHITALRGDGVNPPLLGMRKVVSEDAVRRALKKIPAGAGIAWLRQHLDYTVGPLLSEPWILDVDTTAKPLFGHQEGAVIGYNPRYRGRPSHIYHTDMMAELRLALEVEVVPGDQHTSKHAAPGLWQLLRRLGPSRQPWLIRGDADWGSERVMAEAEAEGLDYLFKLRVSANVKRLIERSMGEAGWQACGQGWQGKQARLKLTTWSRERRVVVLRRRLKEPLALAERGAKGQLSLGFIEVGQGEVHEYAVLVTSLDQELLTIAQLYRDRADVENAFDELKNQWGWGGFTTRKLKPCRLMARIIALVYNWWNLFARLADPDHHREAITSRPLLLHAVARQITHAGQTWLSVGSLHGLAGKARRALTAMAAFFATLRTTAEQLSSLERWLRILAHALRKYLKGRPLMPPLLPAAT
jgi:hypothetical protein